MTVGFRYNGSLWLALLLSFALLLTSCSSGGDSSLETLPSGPSPVAETQAVENVLQSYSESLQQEDIDRLQALFRPQDVTSLSEVRQQEVLCPMDDGFEAAQTFLERIAETFRTTSSIDIEWQQQTLSLASDCRFVTFLEMQSVEIPQSLQQQTRVFRTTFELDRTETAGTVNFRIAVIRREGPLVNIVTEGLLLAGRPARVEVFGPSEAFVLAEVEVSATSGRQVLTQRGSRFQSVIPLPALASEAALHVQVRDVQGETLEVTHRYRVQQPDALVVQRLEGTGTTRFQALALAADGTVWAGGDRGGRLYQVSPGATTARFVGRLLTDEAGRVEALVFDASEDRPASLHVVVFSPLQSGVIEVARTPTGPVFCQTVNVFDRNGEPNPTYPFRVEDPLRGEVPSPSTRAIAASGGSIWLFGSDGGVARVQSEAVFQDGDCGEIDVMFDDLVQRQGSALPVNTVPALVEAADGALWFGTVLGLTRRLQGQFTPVPFAPGLAVPEQVATLEAFFQDIAQAIFEARPITTVRIGEVSLVEALGQAISKEDLIFSAVEDGRGRLWAGTLGGGLRRIEARDGQLRDTLHLTRTDGLGSNIVLALAAAPDETVWAATDEGLSHIRDDSGSISLTHFSALHGLSPPVRDVEVGADGVVWVASDNGLFRLLPQGGVVQGVVRDIDGRPVAGVDILVVGTAFRAVTDAQGRFTLAGLPPGTFDLLIDGSQAAEGQFGDVVRDVTVTDDLLPIAVEVTVEPVTAPIRLVRVSRAAQTQMVGTRQDIAVEVIDAQGRPVSGIPVTFTTAEGRGALSPSTVSSTATGRASAAVTFVSAGLNRVQAQASGAMVEFAVQAQADRTKARLIQVSGNNQSGRLGEELPEPLVVRLEDQFGNPLAGEVVNAVIEQGNGQLVSSSTVLADATGQADFTLQIGSDSSEQDDSDTTDLIIRVTALSQTIRFLAIVGAVDLPGVPEDLVLSDTVAYVADGTRTQIVDISNPEAPRQVGNGLRVRGQDHRLALADPWLYILTSRLRRLHILDITDRLAPEALMSVDLEGQEADRAAGVAVQEGMAYIVATNENETTGDGILQVVDVREPSSAQLLFSSRIQGQPATIAVAHGVAYVPAGDAGLLLFDLSDPAQPMPLPGVAGRFRSSIAIEGELAYAVEEGEGESRLTVFDLRLPTAPQRRGSVRTLPVRQTRRRFPIASPIVITEPYAYLVEFAAGLRVLDISNPDRPLSVGRIDVPSEALRLAATRDLIYVTDFIFGLLIVQGPDANSPDTDLDGVVDFFDTFPFNPDETKDTDGDGLGDKADDDDDNDSFSDIEEQQRGTDPTDSRLFPVSPPPEDATTVFVDAATGLSPRERQGTSESPYRSITEALRALQTNSLPNLETLMIRAGVYSPSTTLESFPLDFADLANLTVRGEAGRDRTVLDAAFTSDVMLLESGITLEGVTLTHGAFGLFAVDTNDMTIRDSRMTANGNHGILLRGPGMGHIVTRNVLDLNGLDGISVNLDANVIITDNTMRDNNDEGSEIIDAVATFSRNVVTDNRSVGVVVSGGAEAELTENMIMDNGTSGVLIDNASIATLINNVIDLNSGDGIEILRRAAATVTGGAITRNTRHGIFLQNGSTADIGLSGDVLSVTDHGGAGIFITEDGSLARIDRTRIVFDNNMIDEIVGPFMEP